MEQTAVFQITKRDLDSFLKEVAKPQQQFITVSNAKKRFDCSKELLQAMADQGRIKQYSIPQVRKSIRYDINELLNLFQEK